MNYQVLHGQVAAMARNPRFTYMVLLTGVSIIAISHLLPQATQVALANLIRHPVILTILLVVCMAVGYYNFITGLLLLLLIICFVLPMLRPVTAPVTQEGFKSSAGNDVSLKNPAILNMFDGPLGRTLAKQKKEADAFNDIKKAEDRELEYTERRKFKQGKDKSTTEDADEQEDFEDTEVTTEATTEVTTEATTEDTNASTTDKKKPQKKANKENFKTVEQRKFNPADNDDMNLLMTMEICDDIKNRIKYVYEDNGYLKKYIREKIEEIVDMLDLVPADS
jgi:hypothetical protein